MGSRVELNIHIEQGHAAPSYHNALLTPLNYNGCPEQETQEEGHMAQLHDGATL
jgi:hypothetical protein